MALFGSLCSQYVLKVTRLAKVKTRAGLLQTALGNVLNNINLEKVI